MIALVRGLISAIITIAAVFFALGNRQAVTLVWSPVNDAVTLPLFVVGLGALGIGFVAGALMIWVRTLGCRFEIRRQKRRIAALERDLDAPPPNGARGGAQHAPSPDDQLLLEDLGAL